MKKSSKVIYLLLMLAYLSSDIVTGSTDTISSSQSIQYGETIISSGGMFELGFFSHGGSNKYYVGMWYKKIPGKTVVWVANRGNPLTNASGTLKVMEPGQLVLLNGTNGIVWSSTASRSVQTPVAQLLDSGNLVVKDESEDDFLWQSFDYPSDTYLPGMKFGWNHMKGLETYLSSWKTDDDPDVGEYTYQLDPTGYPQIVLKKNTNYTTRFGPWNGLYFSGLPITGTNATYYLTFVMNKSLAYFQETIIDRSVIRRLRLDPSGVVQRWIWVDRTQEWKIYLTIPVDNCDHYNICGAFGYCNIGTSPPCRCLDRFIPKDSEAWNKADWSDGCIRRANMTCQGDKFLKYSGIKLPDARNSWTNEGMTLEECRIECLKTCSCAAYTQLNISSGEGCLLWFEELLDIRTLSPYGQDIYIRLSSSESDSKGNKRKILIASLISAIGTIVLGLIIILHIQKRKKDSKKGQTGSSYESNKKDSDLPLYNFSTILKATNYFSNDNKLGEGGFGPVYKGIVEEGQEIAVKRLSKTSTQGLDEFKNEVIFIAKLQHRNLVRLLGCCIQGDENMLIYEYLSNKSLDMFLFDQTKSVLLDWPKRFHIINGIARGLVYLHQDSRLNIIHRDLKASNILLDSDMNPKISDFGTARSFGGNLIEDKTQRVVGTYGYMSPEYAVDGIFSVKSDVFSFGVLVLEIVSGQKNRGFSHNDHHLNLLGHAWMLYKERRALELPETGLLNSSDLSEVLRTIHVGLLCVQQFPEDRPSMSSVVLMLGNEGVLPQAKQPGFYTVREPIVSQNSTSTTATNSVNEVTITLLDAR